MYASPRRGLGVDWGQVLQTSIQTVGNIFTGGQTGTSTTPRYPGTTYPATTGQVGAMDWTTVALIGVGAFLLVRAMK